jgi:hypothetical protein
MGLMMFLWRESDIVKGNMGIQMGFVVCFIMEEEEEELGL